MLIEAVLWNAVLATALAVVVALAERTPFLRRRPAVTHLLWFAVLLKLVIPPLVPLPFLPRATADVPTKTIAHQIVHQAESLETAQTIHAPMAASVPTAAAPAESWQPDSFWVLLAVSFAGTLVFLAHCAWRSVPRRPAPANG